LQKISVSGGAPVTIAVTDNPFGATWGRDGRILFSQPAGIMRVSSDGGAPELIIKSNGNEAVHGPSLLPDGETILYTRTRVQGPARWDQAEVVAHKPGADPKVLIRGGSDAVYASSGHLVYAIGNVLYAIAFDADALETRSGPVPIVNGVQRAVAPGTNSASANFGLSATSALVYLNAVTSATTPESTLGIVTREGTIRALEVPKANYRSPRVSPDGRRIAVETITETGQGVIWVYDLGGTVAIRRLTQEGNNTRPVWAPDSRRIAYGSDRDKKQGIFWQLADGSGLPERLTTAEDGHEHYPESFSRDGRVLSFAKVRPPLGANSWGLWTLRLDGKESKSDVFFDLPGSNEFGSAFSPDGKWLAYASNASAEAGGNPTAFAIYLQPYPPTGVKYQISASGGAWPLWSPNGAELLYRLNVQEGGTPRVNAVAITTTPVPAFTTERVLTISGFQPVVNYREYDVFPNGRELVMVFPATRTQTAETPTARIHTVLNWFEELKRRVPVEQR
jgi:Tol biopolymer transport system component